MNTSLNEIAGVARRQYPVGPQKPDPAVAALAAEMREASNPTPKQNDLGSLHGELNGPAVKPSIKTVAKRYFSSLYLSSDIAAIRAGHAALHELRASADAHSPVIREKEISRLSEIYAVSPTMENLDALRHAKSLDASDCSLAQQHCRNKIKQLMAELSPVLRPVCVKAGELLKQDAEYCWLRNKSEQESWGIQPEMSAFNRGLFKLAEEIGNLGKAVVPFEDIPAIVHAVLELDDEEAAQTETEK